jgi:hypothetical protein
MFLFDVPEAEPLSDPLGAMTLVTRNLSQKLAISDIDGTH